MADADTALADLEMLLGTIFNDPKRATGLEIAEAKSAEDRSGPS